MPFREYAQYLRDISEKIGNIETFLDGLTFEQAMADRRTEAAIERELQILTEAAIRLGDQAEKLCPGPQLEKYSGLRKRSPSRLRTAQ